MGKVNQGIECGGGILAVLSTITQTNEKLQTVQLIICIVGALIAVAFGLLRLFITYKQAMKDGVLDDNEKQQLIDEIKQLQEQIVKDTEEIEQKSQELKEFTKNGRD